MMPTDNEVRSIFMRCSNVILEESFPFWSGDPRSPQPSKFGKRDERQLEARPFRPIDEWISKARPFSPLRAHFLSDGPHIYFRNHLENLSSQISRLNSEQDKQEMEYINKFIEALAGVSYSLNKLSGFYEHGIVGPSYTIIRRVARRGIIGEFDPDIYGEKAVEWLENNRNQFHDSMQHLLGEKSIASVDCLQKMALEGQKTIRLQEGRGMRRAFWRHDFVSALAHLWRNVYSSLPGSNPDNRFLGMVDAAWMTVLECASEAHINVLTGDSAPVDDSRLRQFEEMKWERTVRDVLAGMRQDIQYKSNT